MTNWTLASSRSATGEAKRYDVDHLGRRVTIFIRPHNVYGHVMRATIGKRRVRLPSRFRKNPYNIKDWQPAVYPKKEPTAVKKIPINHNNRFLPN